MEDFPRAMGSPSDSGRTCGCIKRESLGEHQERINSLVNCAHKWNKAHPPVLQFSKAPRISSTK